MAQPPSPATPCTKHRRNRMASADFVLEGNTWPHHGGDIQRSLPPPAPSLSQPNAQVGNSVPPEKPFPGTRVCSEPRPRRPSPPASSSPLRGLRLSPDPQPWALSRLGLGVMPHGDPDPSSVVLRVCTIVWVRGSTPRRSPCSEPSCGGLLWCLPVSVGAKGRTPVTPASAAELSTRERALKGRRDLALSPPERRSYSRWQHGVCVLSAGS